MLVIIFIKKKKGLYMVDYNGPAEMGSFLNIKFCNFYQANGQA